MVKKAKRIRPFGKIYPLTRLPKLSKKHTDTQVYTHAHAHTG